MARVQTAMEFTDIHRLITHAGDDHELRRLFAEIGKESFLQFLYCLGCGFQILGEPSKHHFFSGSFLRPFHEMGDVHVIFSFFHQFLKQLHRAPEDEEADDSRGRGIGIREPWGVPEVGRVGQEDASSDEGGGGSG